MWSWKSPLPQKPKNKKTNKNIDTMPLDGKLKGGKKFVHCFNQESL